MALSNTAVLIVEDDPGTERLERRLLEDNGFRVNSVASGEEAIALVSDSEPDLILLDIGLPGIDGFTTCSVIRKFSQAPIIMVTGNDSTSDKVKGIDIGADDYIAKPFSGEELLVRAKAILRRFDAPQATVSWTGRARSSGPNLGGVLSVGQGLARKISRVRKSDIRILQSKAKESGRQLVANLRSMRNEGIVDVYANAPLGETFQEKQIFSQQTWSQYLKNIKSFNGRVWTWLRERGLRAYVFSQVQLHRVKSNQRVQKFAQGFSEFGQSDLAITMGKFGPKIVNATSKVDADEVADVKAAPTGDVYVRVVTQDEPEAVDLVPVDEPPPLVTTATETNDRTKVRMEEFRHLNLMDALLTAYLDEACARCEDPMLSSPVVPIIDIFPQVAQLLGKNVEYSTQMFAEDIYRLQISGVGTSVTGAKLQLPISRGVPGKTLTVVDESGREVRYYGIRFVQSPVLPQYPDSDPRSFDPLEAPLYCLEIRDILAKQLDWPSAEFAAFIADQLRLNQLGAAELRLFAQMTRDALGQFREEQGDGPSPRVLGKVVNGSPAELILPTPPVNAGPEAAPA